MASQFLSTEENNSCLLCNRAMKRRDKTREVGEKGLDSLKAIAERWSKIEIPITNEKNHFTEISLRLSHLKQHDSLWMHMGCRADFMLKVDQYEKKYGSKEKLTSPIEQQEHEQDIQLSHSIHDGAHQNQVLCISLIKLWFRIHDKWQRDQSCSF